MHARMRALARSLPALARAVHTADEGYAAVAARLRQAWRSQRGQQVRASTAVVVDFGRGRRNKQQLGRRRAAEAPRERPHACVLPWRRACRMWVGYLLRRAPIVQRQRIVGLWRGCSVAGLSGSHALLLSGTSPSTSGIRNGAQEHDVRATPASDVIGCGLFRTAGLALPGQGPATVGAACAGSDPPHRLWERNGTEPGHGALGW